MTQHRRPCRESRTEDSSAKAALFFLRRDHGWGRSGFWHGQTLAMAHTFTYSSSPHSQALRARGSSLALCAPHPSPTPSFRFSFPLVPDLPLSQHPQGSLGAPWLCRKHVKRRVLFPVCLSIAQPLCPEQHCRESPAPSCPWGWGWLWDCREGTRAAAVPAGLQRRSRSSRNSVGPTACTGALWSWWDAGLSCSCGKESQPILTTLP